MTKLSLANLPKIAAKAQVPKYKRAAQKAGIQHIGVGNFHRAHLGVYLDDLFNTGLDLDWSIIGAGVMPSDAVMREKLKEQDYLTTIVEQDNEVSHARVTGPMVDFIPPGAREALIAAMTDPAIRIVSLTVTEGGYMIDPATGKFDPNHPAIRKDAANPQAPESVFGLILLGLARRKAKGLAPFTVMSCDNVPHNGVVTRNAIAGLARLYDPALADWVMASVAFPNGMVDRITPATSDREREMTRSMFGIEDNWPVFCEEFKQWVVEDRFSMGRPQLEKVGVTFVDDVTPYEHMKIRILNGGHAIIAYAGGLMDIHFVHEAMENPLIRAFLDKVEKEEVIPTVPPVPNTDLGDYYKLIVRRFSNPKIGDTIRRLCLDGSNRQPKFIVPPIAEQLKSGGSIAGLALESALWCRYCAGTTDSGKVIEPNDPNWAKLQELAKAARGNPDVWLGMQDIYGHVGKDPRFRDAFHKALSAVWKNGAAATIEAYLKG
ncbi:mannitol dehydrogenase family protein [Aestuariivirga sp.]|uniref:mannitol dehydrogenase family protein n=1 Tax=Aestuariivirga sp. TaxID=2650926 RepID=UPI0039E4AEA7